MLFFIERGRSEKPKIIPRLAAKTRVQSDGLVASATIENDDFVILFDVNSG